MLETVRWVPSNANVRALQAAQPWAHNSAADEPASRRSFGQRIHTSTQNSSLAPRRRTRHLPINIHGRPMVEGRLGRKGAWGGREAGAEGSLGRKGAWGGMESGAEGEPGAEGSLGRKGAWGGREPGADGSIGWMGAWGGWESGAEGSLGRMGAWGGRVPGAEGSLGRHGALGGPTDRRGFQPALAPNT